MKNAKISPPPKGYCIVCGTRGCAICAPAKAMSARQSQDAKQLGPKDASAVGLPICPENPSQKDIL